ncbi:MAG TPA: GAF domain-containing protein [Candidatus Limnocylindria bacterium]|nr:GAF domain-containing protein [Candidatus Limnocylindria bacterium]
MAVLDDDPAFADLMLELLETEGFSPTRVEVASADPVEAITRTRPDLLVLDLLGPWGAGGLDLLLRLRTDARHHSLPVLVCSGDVRWLRNNAAQLAKLPHVAVLEKPFRVDAGVGVLRALLAGATLFPQEGGPPDPEAAAALEAWLGKLGRTLRWAVVDAWVPDRRPGLLRCAAAWVASVQLEPFAQVSRRTRLPVGAGLPGRIWVSGRAAWIEDLASDMNFPRLATAHRVNLVSAAAVPITNGREVVGVVAGYDTRLRRPDGRALDRLRKFVEDAGPMLNQAAGARPVEKAERPIPRTTSRRRSRRAR